MKYRVVGTGSRGNAVLYDDHWLVDAGVSYPKLKMFDIRLVMLTHIHSDHFNKNTIKSIQKENPYVRFVCGEWLQKPLEELGINNIDVLEIGKWYNFGSIQICMVQLYHDVPNCGYRIFTSGQFIFHATDTNTLDGISATGYDLYAIEHNYDADTIQEVIAEKKAKGEFSYEIGAINSHLSFQKAEAFIEANKSHKSQVLKLHMSSRYEDM